MHKPFRLMVAATLAACALVASAALTVGRASYDVIAAFAAGAVLAFAMFASILPKPARRLVYVASIRGGYFLAECKERAHRWLQPWFGRLGLQLYAFPGTVTADLAFGIVGEVAFDGPIRTQPARINHGTAADIVVGRWFTLAADGTARPGGAGAIGGMLMNPKTMANIGTAAGGPLAANMVVPTGTIGEFGYMGCFVVAAPAAVALGNAAKYDTTTGIIGVGAPGAGEAAIPNSKFVRVFNAAAGLAVLELTN